ETQPVYQQQDILATTVTGTRALTGYSSAGTSGIVNGSKFTVEVGSGPVATINFQSSTRITATINGTTTNFTNSSNDGSWRTALVNALNSVTGLTASFNGAGDLQLQT